VLFLHAAVSFAWAQTTSTEILGLVRDSSGSVVPGAKVTVTRKTTGEVRNTLTNDAGLYSFPLIEPGQYDVTVEAPAFKKHVVSVQVQFQQRTRVNATLEVGAVTEQVLVQAEAALLNTEDVSVGQNIDSARIVELPVVSRNVGQLAVLVPGVSFGGRSGATTGLSGLVPEGTVALIANGQHEVNQTITLDGVDAKEPRRHTMQLTPSFDALEEFRVLTSNYSAEYGLGGGARVQISMKSGTNDFHGSLYEFVRNNSMDAEDYFLNFELAPGEQRRTRNRLQRHQFGAFLSGPVVLPFYNGRQRTFWSFNYEARRENRESPQTAWFPSEAMRSGDFSELLNPVDASGRVVRAPIIVYDPLNGSPFAGNKIPQARIQTAAQDMIENYVPTPDFRQSDPLDFTNRAALMNTIKQDAFFVRLDHNFTEKDRVFARAAWDHQRVGYPNINPEFSWSYVNNPLNIATQWVHVVSPSVLNELRFGIQKSDDSSSAAHRLDGTFDINSLGIGTFTAAGGRPLEGREQGLPTMTGLGFSFGDIGNSYNDFDSYHFADHFSILRSKHSIKFGFELQHHTITEGDANNVRGTIGFTPAEAGFPFASFLMGYPANSTTPEGLAMTLPRQNLWGLYVQDSWKALPKLTVEAGLRFDFIGVPIDRGGYWRTLDFNRTFTTPEGLSIPTLFPAELGEGGAVPLIDQSNYRHFMPRLGFAYRPNERWVIRAGSGWFANVTLLNNYTIMALMPPLSGSTTYNSVTDLGQQIQAEAGGQTFDITTRRFRPGSPIIQFGPNLFSGTAQVQPEGEITHIQPDRKNSTHWDWSFDIQRQLWLNTAFTVGYRGSRTWHMPGTIENWNTPGPSPDTNFQARRPVQKFHDPLRPDKAVRDLGSVIYIESGSRAWYNALMVSADRRFSRGLAFGANYTYSKTNGDSDGPGNWPPYPVQNPRDLRASRGPASFDRTHVIMGNFVYELPFARNLKGAAGALLNGWQINGIVALRSGFPITITQSSDLNTGTPSYHPVRPDRVADGRLDNPTRQLWFDPNAFRRVTCNIPNRLDLCHFGNSGTGIIRGHPQRSFDASVFKTFSIRERARLEVRGEAFNSLNTPWFGAPNGLSFRTNTSLVPDGPRIGEIRSLNAPMRILQLGAKLIW
jgi:hypothetical protein